MGLLIQFLVAMGNMFSRNGYRLAEGARHYPNLFAVLVGDTSHGRKGSAWAQILRLMRLIDPTWANEHVQGGLASGEGLIWAVRDPIEKQEAVKQNGTSTGEYETVVIDPGITDKRLQPSRRSTRCRMKSPY